MNQISIGIISYNEEKNILNLLNSIKCQYLGKFFIKEIIISDDSNDKTPFLIKDFIKKNPQLLIRLFHHNERRGAYAGWNEIFKETTGEYLVLYDADVILAQKTTYNLVAIDYFLQIKVLELEKQIRYVNNAILYFKSPENLEDFLSQVLRANVGHKQLSLYKTKKLSIISNIKITLKSILLDPLGGISTLYCYCFIPYYKMRNQKKILSKWEIAQSTKS